MKDRVTAYAKRVVSGKVVCGKLHRLACERHLSDIKKQDTDEFPYYWDPSAATESLDFAESLTVIEGFESREVKLLDCQAFDIGATFGWKRRDGYRRFRRRYKSMARQQGKTMENGTMGTYIAAFGGYRYGKLFTVATKKRQARIAWEEMQRFIDADADLSEWFEIKDYKSTITALNTNCTIEALSKEAGLDDGFRSIFSSLDEIHQMRDNKVYKALLNGTRSLPETLMSMITTRGDNLNSFCKEIDDYAVKVLQGVVSADDFFVDIYCLDENDDPFDEKNWIKSNPYTASTKEGMEKIRVEAQTAKDMGGSDLRDFLTKCMNIWFEDTDSTFIDAEKWISCGTGLTLDDFRNERCWVGLDLSAGGDLTTIALEFEDGERTYTYSHSFMPRGRLTEHVKSDVAPYDLWEQK
ncbi:MAG: terminase large subunit, partial [Raoultibacter sp.]